MTTKPHRISIFVAFMLGSIAACAQAPDSCPPDRGIALQVLGSGGPIADDGRASAAYLIWVDGKSRVLIDAGGGSFLRFGEAGASFADLDFVGLSHFHTDHSADFPALLKSGNFSGRSRELTVSGPSGSPRFPGLGNYLSSMLDSGGAYAYLNGYLSGTGGLAKLLPIEVDVGGSKPLTVFGERDMRIDAIGVPHGIVPAVAFKVTIGDVALVFSSDQNMSNPVFADLARGAAVLVVHMPIPENAGDAARSLHALPSELAEVANDVQPQVLVVSHFMARSLRDPANALDVLRARYSGVVIPAEDLICHSVMTR